MRRALRLLSTFGFDPKLTLRSVRALPAFFSDYSLLKKQARVSDVDFPIGRLRPCLVEKEGQSGTASGHYFHQDLLVASRIHRNNPEKHVDVGSRVDGFVAHVAAFREIEVFDVREMKARIPNVRFTRMDITDPDERYFDYCDSLSCLHALEHFGLGRYGDPVLFEGHLVGFENLSRVLKPGGTFHFSVPIGSQRIEFNAHRVFSIRYLLEMIRPRYEIVSFAYVDDRGNLHTDVDLSEDLVAGNFGCRYGCGIFELTRRP